MPRLLARSSWGPRAGLGPAMRLPAQEAWFHHSVTPLTGDPIRDMRLIETVGIQRFGRFSYSWAYHAPTRTWLEGAGTTVGAHTGGRNSKSFGMVVIGNTNTLDLPHFAEDAAWLIRHLIVHRKLRSGVMPTGGHRDLKATACPGDHAYAAIPPTRRLVANPTQTPTPAPTPKPKEGFLMALSDKQQEDLLAHVEYLRNNTASPRLVRDTKTKGIWLLRLDGTRSPVGEGLSSAEKLNLVTNMVYLGLIRQPTGRGANWGDRIDPMSHADLEVIPIHRP